MNKAQISVFTGRAYEDMPVKAAPYNHQIQAFRFVCRLFGLYGNTLSSRGAALLMEMGCGKTLTTIGIVGALYNAGKIRRVLVVTPLSILSVWREEFEKFADFQYEIHILCGSTAQKAETLKNLNGGALQVVVVNYESAWRLEEQLRAYNADVIVADEGHKIKTHNAKQSKAMHRLGARARYRLLLTGTIITNKAIDVFSQYKFVNPAIFGPSFYTFRNRYFNMVGYGNHTPVLKRSMERELTDRLHSIAYRTTKAECLDLPETTDIVRYVELEPSARRAYKDLVNDSYAELAKGEVTATNVLTRLLRLSQLTGGFVGTDSDTVTAVSTAKLEALSDIVDEAANEDRKLVVIARFIAEIRAIEKLLQKKKLRYSLIMGGVKDRDVQVSEFQNNPDVKIFVGQIATAGLGITLTAASTMVFYSLDYSMSNFEQTKARIHRVGQKQNCSYLYLTASGTVDEKVLKALRSKADLARTLVDDYKRGRNPFEGR
jgi:SNF2 family DNA or RNA helicase